MRASAAPHTGLRAPCPGRDEGRWPEGTRTMPTLEPTPFLRRVLKADALLCLAAAVLHLGFAARLESLLDLSAPRQ